MRYHFIEQHRGQWPVEVQCHVLQVSRSGYYAWRKRPVSARDQRREELTRRIREIHARPHHDAYGAPRVQQKLEAEGQACNRKTVAKCMKAAGIQASTKKKFRVLTTDSNHPHPVAENSVDRNFSPSRKNETWTADITYIPTAEGWLYRSRPFTRRSSSGGLSQAALGSGMRLLRRESVGGSRPQVLSNRAKRLSPVCHQVRSSV